MHRITLVVVLSIFFHSCNDRPRANHYDFQWDTRWGTKYFSISLDDKGKGHVVRGRGSLYTLPSKVITTDSSGEFKIDSVESFFASLNRMRTSPFIDTSQTDAPRIEIYYKENKIYDAFRISDSLWQLFRYIIPNLPKGQNPFNVQEKPFD